MKFSGTTLFAAITVTSLLFAPGAHAAGKNFRTDLQRAKALAAGQVAVGQAGVVAVDMRDRHGVAVVFADGARGYFTSKYANTVGRDQRYLGSVTIRSLRAPQGGGTARKVDREFDVNEDGTVSFRKTVAHTKNPDRPRFIDSHGINLTSHIRTERQVREPNGQFGKAGAVWREGNSPTAN